MSSYHTSFDYLGKNSMADYNLIITHFDNYDNGETESYLSLDPVYRDSHRNMRRTLYGTKYSNVALLDITVIHADKSEFTIEQTRSINRWLTGSQQYTWMDLYLDDEVKYRMHCYVKDVKPYKMDSRIIGFIISVESSSPWCYSALQKRTVSIAGETAFEIECETDDVYSYVPLKVTFEKISAVPLLYDEEGVVRFEPYAIVYDEDNKEVKATVEVIESDGYIAFDDPTIQDISLLKITNMTINNETTTINNLSENEIVVLTENMMIQSDREQRIFGDDFNYVWPKLKNGINEFEAQGYGYLTFEYVLPMKVSDCVYEIKAEIAV